MSPLITRLMLALLIVCIGFTGTVPLLGSLLPHSSEIVYVSSQGKRPAIYRMDITHRLSAPLTDDEAGSYSPAWSPDGQWIAFHSDRDSRRELYLMDAFGKNVRRLTDNHSANDSPSWSPDGRHLTFYSDYANEYNIYIMDMTCTGEFLQCNTPLLLHDLYWNANPVWSPDGTRIAFQSNQESENTNIYVMNADGSNVHRLTANIGEDYAPAWSPDSRSLLYVAQNTRQRGTLTVYWMDDKGGNPHEIIGGVVDLTPSWSRDGRYILFSSNISGDFELYLADADGGNMRRLTHSPGDDFAPKWRP